MTKSNLQTRVQLLASGASYKLRAALETFAGYRVRGRRQSAWYFKWHPRGDTPIAFPFGSVPFEGDRASRGGGRKGRGKGEQRAQRRGEEKKYRLVTSHASIPPPRGNRLLSSPRRSFVHQAACTRIKLSGEIETEPAMLSRHADRGMRPPPAPTAVAASYQLVRNVLQRADLRQPSRRYLETCSSRIERPSNERTDDFDTLKIFENQVFSYIGYRWIITLYCICLRMVTSPFFNENGFQSVYNRKDKATDF